MKTLLFFTLITLLSSCSKNNKTITIGSCVQSPDEITVWKVLKVSENSFEAKSNRDNKIEKKILSKTWVTVNCL